MTKSSSPQFRAMSSGAGCFDLGHGANIRMQGNGEKFLSEHSRVRQSMMRTLLRDRVSNMRVLDTMGCLTNTTNPPEQLTALKHITARDNVHLTEDGYNRIRHWLRDS